MRIFAVAGLTFATVACVLGFAASEGRVPRWAVPLPLSFAASAGKARVIFCGGLVSAALIMVRTLPVVLAAYSAVLGPGLASWLLWALRISLRLTVIGLFLQALIPFDKDTLEPLRNRGELKPSASKWNALHGLGAMVLFSCCFVAYVVVLTISLMAHELGVMFKLLPPAVMPLGFKLAIRLCPPTPLPQQQIDLDGYVGLMGDEVGDHPGGIDETRQQAVRVAGAGQVGIVSAMIAFMVVMANDVSNVCSTRPADACKPAAPDEDSMNLVFVFLAICTLVVACCRRRW